jgi:hypothetical protein
MSSKELKLMAIRNFAKAFKGKKVKLSEEMAAMII